ncbi:hypothetical protein PENSPDRAFT_668160 [Peniophora sp. CONT]|nr:hypothetical protein PENSPDRAFT_668160 [Peniophora sp. CONT]
MDYRRQCFDSVKMFRFVRDDLKLDPKQPEYSELERLVCKALNYAVSHDPEAESAFDAFRSAVDDLRASLEISGCQSEAAKLCLSLRSARSRALKDKCATQNVQEICDEAQKRADEAAEREAIAAAREAAARGAGATGAAQSTSVVGVNVRPVRHRIEFAVAPSLASREPWDEILPNAPLQVKSVTRLSFSVNSSTSVPELLFRFQREYRALALEEQHIPLNAIKCPNFYAEPDILNLTATNAHPLRNDELRLAIAKKMVIWVYGDRPGGFYQLERPFCSPCTTIRSPGRVRSISIAPPPIVGGQQIWAFRDLQGQITPGNSIFRPNFSLGHFECMAEGRRIYQTEDRQLCIGPIRRPNPGATVDENYGPSAPPSHPVAYPQASNSMAMPEPQHSTEAIRNSPSLPLASTSESPTLARPIQLPELELPGSRLSGLSTLFSPSPVQVEGERAAPSLFSPSPAPALFPEPTLLFAQSSLEVPASAQVSIAAKGPPLRSDADPSSTPAVRSPPLLSRGQSLPNLPIHTPLGSNIALSPPTAIVVPSRTTPSPPRSPPPSSASSSTISWIPPLPSLTRVNTAFSDAARTDDSEVMSPRTPAASPRPPLTPQHAETPSMPPPLPPVAVVELNEQLPLQAPSRYGVWSRVKSFYASVLNATTQATEQGSGGHRMPGSLQ